MLAGQGGRGGAAQQDGSGSIASVHHLLISTVSPVLAVLSIPTSTLPPSPPLRLLCAEAAFRCLVLQGGEGEWEGRLVLGAPHREVLLM